MDRVTNNERRTHPRMTIELFAYYQELNELSDDSKKATVLNMSPGGLCIFSSDRIAIDTVLKLNIKLGMALSVDLDCEVIWCQPIADIKRFRIGVSITNVKGKDFESFLVFYYEQMASL